MPIWEVDPTRWARGECALHWGFGGGEREGAEERERTCHMIKRP